MNCTEGSGASHINGSLISQKSKFVIQEHIKDVRGLVK